MKLHLIVSLATWILTFSASGQGAFLYDQQSATESSSGGGLITIQLSQPLGQSFIPTFTSVGFVRLKSDDAAVNGLGATLVVNLRSDSISGPILGSTDPVLLPDGFQGYPDFFFPNPVQVTPGATYYFQPSLQSGETGWKVVGYNYGYLNGTLFMNGTADSFNDLWFREGVIVPEPSSVWFALVGAGLLALWQRAKSRRHRSRS